MWIKQFLICLLAGAGAGISTGFAGLSAAAFITPILVGFLDIPVYEAVGIALASDVLASAFSTITYARSGNIDLKKGKPLFLTVILYAILGSVIAYFLTRGVVGDTIFGYWAIIACIVLGITFLFRTGEHKPHEIRHPRLHALSVVLSGAYIGLICGFQGTGGGMMMLFVLTSIMQFEFRSAVGTSLFIMTFTALIGAVTHFWINGLPEISPLTLCMFSTLLFAQLAAFLAQKLKPRILYLITGGLLIVSGIATLIGKIL